MSKSDFPALRMVIENGRLAPATQFDQERLNSYRRGTVVYVRFTEEKDRVLVRKWFAILGLVLKQCQTPWKNKDEAHEAIKLALGIVNLSKTVTGQYMAYPKSLSDLEDPELQEALTNMTELLSRMTGVDVETLSKEAGSVGADEAAQPSIETEQDTGRDPSTDPEEGAEAPPPASVPSPIHFEWLRNIARMLIAATHFGGEMDLLKNQKNAALLSYERPADCPEIIRGKAQAVYGYCEQIVLKELEMKDGLAVIAGVCGCEPDDLQWRAP